MNGNTEKTVRKYHYGLDLLRIISMFMIVVTHVLGKGEIRSSVSGESDPYFITTWIIQVLVYGAVNCYALISGYVGVHTSYKYSKLANIWLQVFFYSFGITFFIYLLGFPVGLKDWQHAFLPIVSGNYWYITAYFGLLIFIPVINAGLRGLSDRQLGHLVLLMTIVFSVLPAVMNNSVAEFSLSKGFEMTWLMILYILGAYLERLDLEVFRRSYLLMLFFFCMFVTYVMKFLVGNIWYWYVSPSLSLGAVSLFIIFAKMPLSEKSRLYPFIVMVSPATLGIYLAHLHPLLVKFFIRDFAESFVEVPIVIYPFLILAVSVMIYCLAFLIEKGRQHIFQWLKVAYFLKWIDEKIPFEDN